MKNIKSFSEYVNKNWKHKLISVTLAASTLLNIGCMEPNKKQNKDYDFNKTELYESVINAVNDNQIQAARDLVSTTDEKNDLYNFIRDNKIQSVRNYINYTIKK